MIERNSKYIFKAKEILKRFSSNNTEAFIVGETVRNLLLDIELNEVEIFTILKKDNAKKILSDLVLLKEENFSLVYLDGDFKIRISFIKFMSLDASAVNAKYKITNNNGPFTTIEFLAAKDFTINTLIMSSKNVVTDHYGGKKDLDKKKISTVYRKPKEFFENDPIKILSAIRLVSLLGFNIDKKTFKAMNAKAKYTKECGLSDISVLMKDILTGPFYRKAFYYMDKLELYKYLKIYKYGLRRFHDGKDDYRKFDYDFFLSLLMVKKKRYIEEIAQVSNDEFNVMNLVNLALTNPKGNYDKLTLYSNTLSNLIKANRINHALKRAKSKVKTITKEYTMLPIKKTCDLAFKGQDIIDLIKDKCELDYKGGPELTDLIDEIILNVINGELENEYNSIRRFVINNLERITGFKILHKDNIKKTNPGETDDYEEYCNRLKEQELINEVDNKYAQEELENRLLEKLKTEFEEEVESCIERSGMLDGLNGGLREASYDTLRKVYFDIVISKKKYEKLKELFEKC